VSQATKLCGFLLLLVVIFACAYAAGAHLGPVTVDSHLPWSSSPGGNPNSGGGGGSMNMGGGGSMNMGGP
jgi:hypothetical protein